MQAQAPPHGRYSAARHALQDDATVLVLDWHGVHDGSRDAVSWAAPSRASEPLA